MNIYLVTYEGIAVHGIALLGYLLAERGISMHYLGSDLNPVKAKEGMLLIPTVTIDRFDLDRCDALIVPGGLPEGFNNIPWLGELMRAANEKGIVVGAMCAATQTLAVHGLLKGKCYTSSFDLAIAGAEGCRNMKTFAYRDGNVISGRGQGFLDFAVLVLQALGLCDDREAKQIMKRYAPLVRKAPWGLKPFEKDQKQ